MPLAYFFCCKEIINKIGWLSFLALQNGGKGWVKKCHLFHLSSPPSLIFI